MPAIENPYIPNGRMTIFTGSGFSTAGISILVSNVHLLLARVLVLVLVEVSALLFVVAAVASGGANTEKGDEAAGGIAANGVGPTGASASACAGAGDASPAAL
jgi:hypothetical protein